MIYGLWYGGFSYSQGRPVEDLEIFYSLLDCLYLCRSRRDIGWAYKQHFNFVNRDPEIIYTPAVDYSTDKSSVYNTVCEIWFEAEEIDGKYYVDEYPDSVILYGLRGGFNIRKVSV